MKKSDFKNLLKNRNFVLLWTDQIFSQLSYNFVNFALMVWVYQLTKSNFAVAILILTFIIPTALLSIFTGVFADFFDKRKIMFFIDILWATLVLGFIFIKDKVLIILTLSFIVNCVDRFFNPAEQASLPSLVSGKELLLANSLFSISSNISFVAGLSLAGPMMLFLGNDSPFITASIFTYLGAICVYFLPEIKTYAHKKSIFKIILDDTLQAIKDGYSFILEKNVVKSSIIFLTIFHTFINIASSLGPGYAEDTLGIDVRNASLIFALPLGLGLILGIYLMNKWQGKILKRRMVQKGLLIGGFGILALGLGPLISNILLPKVNNYRFSRPFTHLLSLSSISFIVAFFLGLSFSFMVIPSMTTLSENTPKNLRGRVWGAMSLFQNTVSALPLLFISAIADEISILPLTFLFAIFAFIAYNLTKKKSLEGFFYG